MKTDTTQLYTECLYPYFESVLPLTDEEKRSVAELFNPRLYKKKQYVLQEGAICIQFNFVVSGCLRMYKLDEKGNIHITQFIAENRWLTDFESYNGKKPSEFNIDALEDTIVLQITNDNLQLLYNKHPKFKQIFMSLIESCYVSLQKRLVQNMSSNAEQNYLSFLQAYSHIADRLPQTQIASFLGISPEFLSRLKNKNSE